MTILWPIGVLRPQNVAFDIAPRSLTGPSSISGKNQVVASDAGIWKATFGNVVIKKRDEVLTFRAIDTLLDGQLNPILIPLCRGYQPIPDGAAEAGAYADVPHSDDSLFADGAGYVGSVIDVVAALDAAVRAVSLTVTVGYSGEILPGQHFSIGERLYRVRSFVSSTGAMTFRPPLREAVSAGAQLEFDNPVGRFRLATDNEMDLELQLRRFGSPTVNFIEDV